MKPILEVRGISKTFKISKEQKRYLSLRESVIEKLSFKGQGSKVDFSALENISFDVYPGESVAIIGQNGAGKSTLLKVLSKITPPTRGSITIRGRIAALLEVGTGFHSELTGLENIYLNGSILGLRKSEIKRKIDAIVDFSGVEKFLDTPLKHYSSGMQLRLAFSVAAHLEPEILVIDEVLAVGDVAFQKKCLGKMDEVSKSGRTILFVSHNMEAVEKLTTRGLFLSNGSLQYDGTTSEAVAHYLKYGRAGIDTSISDFKNRTGTGLAKIVKLAVESDSGIGFAKQGEAFKVRIGVELSRKLAYDIALVCEDDKEAPLFCTHMSDLGEAKTGVGYQEFVFEVSKPPFRKGQYQCTVTLFRPDKSEHYDTVFHFPLINIEGLGEDEFPVDNRWGKLYFPIKWESNE